MYVSAVITNGYRRKGEYNLIAPDVIARIGGDREKQCTTIVQRSNFYGIYSAHHVFPIMLGIAVCTKIFKNLPLGR